MCVFPCVCLCANVHVCVWEGAPNFKSWPVRALLVCPLVTMRVCMQAPQAVGWSQQHHSQSSADHLGAVSPSTSPSTPSLSKNSAIFHLRSQLFSLPLLFPPTTLLLKQRLQTWPPGSAGRRFRRTLHDLMKGISSAFWSLSSVCFREPPSPLLKTMQFEVSFVVCLLKT